MIDRETKKEKARRRQALMNKARLYLILHGVSSPRELGSCPLGDKCRYFRGEGIRCRRQRLNANNRIYAVFEKGTQVIAVVNSKQSKKFASRLCASGLVPEESAI